MQDAMRKAAVLIEAMPYLQKFRGKELVVKFGGSAMESTEIIDDILEDVVFLATVGIRTVLVHGGGKRISEAMNESGLAPRFVAGHRVTDADALAMVVDVLTEVNAELIDGVRRHGGRAVSGFQGGESIITVRKKLIANPATGNGTELDIGYVGDVVSVDVERLRRMGAGGDVLILPPVGQDAGGQLYNVNADSAAASVATALSAEKIVFLSDVHGIMAVPGDCKSFLSSIDRKTAEELIEKGAIKGGMLPKVAGCLLAIESGVRKAHIIDGSLKHSLLLEIFTDAGIGTQITGEGSS